MLVSIAPLTPAIGAVVSGVRLCEPLADAVLDEIEHALVRHLVLFFRGQSLSPLQHRALALRFGELHIHPIYPADAAVPEVVVLDTDVTDVRDNAIWHTDVTFTQLPPMGSILIARVLPPNGGDTLWSSNIAAYEALTPPMQHFLGGLTATHDIAQSFPSERFAMTNEARVRLDRAKIDNPPVSHPVVRTHPVSGKKALFVQEGFTTHINELSRPESRALLAFLYRHSVQPEFVVRWQWRVGDVAFWDNRVTQHYATDDYRPARRVMNRATIIGDRPR